MKQKKAVSTIIATILILMLVIVLTTIIFNWSKDFLIDQISGDRNINNICKEIKWSALKEGDGDWGFRNDGNIIIQKYKVFYSEQGREGYKDPVDKIVNPSEVEMVSTATQFSELNLNLLTYTEIKVIPIVIGKSKEGEDVEYECPERFGLEVL